jgi:hypothetical protein
MEQNEPSPDTSATPIIADVRCRTYIVRAQWLKRATPDIDLKAGPIEKTGRCCPERHRSPTNGPCSGCKRPLTGKYMILLRGVLVQRCMKCGNHEFVQREEDIIQCAGCNIPICVRSIRFVRDLVPSEIDPYWDKKAFQCLCDPCGDTWLESHGQTQ